MVALQVFYTTALQVFFVAKILFTILTHHLFTDRSLLHTQLSVHTNCNCHLLDYTATIESVHSVSEIGIFQ